MTNYEAERQHKAQDRMLEAAAQALVQQQVEAMRRDAVNSRCRAFWASVQPKR